MRMTDRDRQRIANDVTAIIMDWSSLVEIRTPKPVSEQPGWNPIMREVVGPIQYDVLLGVPVERRDVPVSELDTTVTGDKTKGESILRIPLQYRRNNSDIDIEVTMDSMFILDGNTNDPWRVKAIKGRIGETEVRIIRMSGDA